MTDLIVGEFYTRIRDGKKLQFIYEREQIPRAVPSNVPAPARYIFISADDNQTVIEVYRPNEVRPFGAPEVNWDLFGNWERFLVMTHIQTWVVSDTLPMLMQSKDFTMKWAFSGFYHLVHESQVPEYSGHYTSSLCVRYPSIHPIPQEGDNLWDL